MIETLKKMTVKTAGFEVKGLGDSVLLSNLILEKTDEFISYNTLRRIFGLVKYAKPSMNTLNTLARFNGYKNYIDFIKIAPNAAYWSEKEKLYLHINDNPQVIVNQLNRKVLNSDYKLDFVISFCRELIYLKNVDVLDVLFQSSFFTDTNFNYSEKLHFGNSIGQLLIENAEIGQKLLHHPNFLNLVYCIHVDYQHLNGYYGKWVEHVLMSSTELHFTAFSEAIFQLKNYLNGIDVSYDKLHKLDKTNFHPILQGRIYSVRILAMGYRTDELNQLIAELNNKEENTVVFDFFHELIILALLSKNFSLMKDIIKHLSEKKLIFHYYQEAHKNRFDLMCLIFNHSKRIQSTHKIKDPKTIKVEREHKYSYRELLTLFELILSYHSDNGNKDELLFQYNRIAKKFKYRLISEEYLLNYFDL
jgi:hypothetical protein